MRVDELYDELYERLDHSLTKGRATQALRSLCSTIFGERLRLDAIITILHIYISINQLIVLLAIVSA